MSTKDAYAPCRRAVGYGVIVTLVLGCGIFLFNFVIDRVIDEVETVIEPCQHGGVWVPALEKCSCVGPWDGTYCSDCTCENDGVCDQINVNVPFSGTLWGCRCPDNWLGSLCDLCTSNKTSDGRCAGQCLEGYYGSKCEKTCVEDATFEDMLTNEIGAYDNAVDLWTAGGEVKACSGHGSCDTATGECKCHLPTWFPSADGRSDCARTCVSNSNGVLCNGHGACTNIDNVVGCVCEYGWHLESGCSLPCPGSDIHWIDEPCAGHGICDSENGLPACSCLNLYLGDACQFKCPTNEEGDASVACNGHGICSVDDSPPFSRAVCKCATGWVGKSCQCNAAQTCSGHGECNKDGNCVCDEFWTGQRCNACVRGRYGSQCSLQCNERRAVTYSADNIGCNSRGVCAVQNFARADESVVCGCAGNFDSETYCRDCKEFYYPKIGESGLESPEEDADVACKAFANRATCNYAGEPHKGFSSPSLTEPPCECDQPFVDGYSFCTVCKDTFYPDGGDMSDPSKCSKRCVDEPDEATWYPDVFTLVCKNNGVCDPTGDFCVCPDGYSGKDCAIACGGDTPCSGHGVCVSNKLQQFMSAEVKNSVSGGTSHRCQCDPQPPMDDNEKLKVFTGEETLGGDSAKDTLEYVGDFCEYSCLKPGFLDAITCNGEPCSVLPIVDNQGSPIITDCTQDSDCGDWNVNLKRLVFKDENGVERSDLSPNELELRGQISLQNRWSPRMGPFCHVPTVPRSLHVANMKCVQRVNRDSVDDFTEANCEAQNTKAKCLAQGGTCRWADVCQEALDDFDEFSYCYELLRTEKLEAFRSENCTSSCDINQLNQLDWTQICEHYESRTPDEFQTCGSNLDEICTEATRPKKTYASVQVNRACADDEYFGFVIVNGEQKSFPPRLEAGNLGYDEDPIQECVNRCTLSYGNDVGGVTLYGNYCGLCKKSCNDQPVTAGYTAVKVVPVKTYQLARENANCFGLNSPNYGPPMYAINKFDPRLTPGTPGYDEDPVQECVNRCVMRYGNVIGAISIKKENNAMTCGFCLGKCDEETDLDDRFTSYHVVIKNDATATARECAKTLPSKYKLVAANSACSNGLFQITSLVVTLKKCQDKCDKEYNCEYVVYKHNTCRLHFRCTEIGTSNYAIYKKLAYEQDYMLKAKNERCSGYTDLAINYNVDTLEKCQYICSKNENCRFVEYNGITFSCTLKDKCDTTVYNGNNAIYVKKPKLEAFNAKDAAAFCYESSSVVETIKKPFSFKPLLDTTRARQLQSDFHPTFVELSKKHACASTVYDVDSVCASIKEFDNEYMKFDEQVTPIYECEVDGQSSFGLVDLSGENQNCKTFRTVRDLNPFVLDCGNSVEFLEGLSLLEAISEALRKSCTLLSRSELHSKGIYVAEDEATSICKAILENELPNDCERVCKDDVCTTVGTSTNNMRIFECEGPDPTRVSDENCLLGMFSTTGEKGGAVYRCAVDASDLDQNCEVQFSTCRDKLILHVDQIGENDVEDGSVRVPSIQGSQLVTWENNTWNAKVPLVADVARVEFDVRITSESRGAVSLVSEDGGIIASILLYHFGGRGWNLNGQTNAEAQPCAAGEGDSCKSSVDINEFYRVVIDVSATHVTALFGSDALVEKERVAGISQKLAYVQVSGSAEVKQIFAFKKVESATACDYQKMCSNLYRKTGRAATWRESLKEIVPFDYKPEICNQDIFFNGRYGCDAARVNNGIWLGDWDEKFCSGLYTFGFGPAKSWFTTCCTWEKNMCRDTYNAEEARKAKTTLDFCAEREVIISSHNSCSPGTEAEHDTVFSAPWSAYCAYYDFLRESGSCNDLAQTVTRELVEECTPFLSKFDSVECAQEAFEYPWEDEYCKPLKQDKSPDLLKSIGCDNKCLQEVEQADLNAFCDARNLYWNDNVAIPRVPEGCVNDEAAQTQWKAVDWSNFCLEKASNTAKGVCSAATCDCTLNGGFLGGDACELSCALGSDGSPCNEDSFSGVCDYRDNMIEAVQDYYEDETKLIFNHRATEILGECKCANSQALAKDGCSVSCDTDNGEPLCNTRNYTYANEEWSISACHEGGTGVCACLPRLTRRITEERSDWRGNKASVLTFEYGGLSEDAFWKDKFRLRASQGAKSLMINFFDYSENTWKQARQKFEVEPALFTCGDQPCDFADVVLAQNLYGTSPFYGPTCSRRCPSVETGETMNTLSHHCNPQNSNLIGADRLTLEACKSECLDNWKCNFIRFHEKTSECRMYEKCGRENDNYIEPGSIQFFNPCPSTHPRLVGPIYGNQYWCYELEPGMGACRMSGYEGLSYYNVQTPSGGVWGANQADCAPDNPTLNPCPNSRPILAHITRESGVKEYFCYQEGVNPDDLALQCSLYHAGIPNPPGAEWGLSETNCDFNLSNFYKFNYTVTWYERELTEKPQLLPCSNRGRCTSQGTCVCDSAKFLSLTDPITGIRIRTGANEVGSLQNIPVTSLDTTGFRGDDCSKVCPGFDPVRSDMSEVCSGHGICTRAATCQCAVGYTGLNCELPCPRLLTDEGEATTTCSGHGNCFEARMNPVEVTVEEEDVMHQYQVVEAWRKWYNLCSENTPIDFLVLPFGNYPGMLNQSVVRGGVNCETVPQIVADDPFKPYVKRPEIQMQGITDFVNLDYEGDLDTTSDFFVHGASVNTDHNRQGVFRLRYWIDTTGTAGDSNRRRLSNTAQLTNAVHVEFGSGPKIIQACLGTPVVVDLQRIPNGNAFKEYSGPSCGFNVVKRSRFDPVLDDMSIANMEDVNFVCVSSDGEVSLCNPLTTGEHTFLHNQLSVPPGERRYFQEGYLCNSDRIEVFCPGGSLENDDETEYSPNRASVIAWENAPAVFSHGEWSAQALFVENYSVVQYEDQRQYEKYSGFGCCDPKTTCDTLTIGLRLTGIETVGECASLCEKTDECACFDYQEFYHSAFFGGCRLTRRGSLHAYPVHRVLRVGEENGLMRKDEKGDLIHFDEFEQSYVVLQESKSCRAPQVVLSENVISLAACAQLCADRFTLGCVYFTYNPTVLRCSQVKTESSDCPEGFNTNPNGFFAVAVVDQGATAPVAYDALESTRLFPKDKPRGAVIGLYEGRARPNWSIAVAQCSCIKSYSFGHWASFACQTCDTYWGGSACTRQCPGMLSGEPCWGNGKCLWGSKDGVGAPGTFYDAVCLCGDPAAPKATDLSLTGTWNVVDFDFHVKATFQKINILTEYFENPNNYGFADAQCRNCIEQRGGRNCASQCSYCLYGGECQFSISDLTSVPCKCTSQYYDTQNGCSPHGFILSQNFIKRTLNQLTKTNQARRLEANPGFDVPVGTFYDNAAFPDVATSLSPSRLFTAPCPNVDETSWMQDQVSITAHSCKNAGTCQDVGTRKVVSQGIPPRYFPTACAELGGDWKSSSRNLWFAYEEKFLLDPSDLESSEAIYVGEGTYASLDKNSEVFADVTLDHFVEVCRRTCIDVATCAGVVLKREYFTSKAWCYFSRYDYIASPPKTFMLEEPNAYFVAYKLQKEYDLCYSNAPVVYYAPFKSGGRCLNQEGQGMETMPFTLSFSDRLSNPGMNDDQRSNWCFSKCSAIRNEDNTLKYQYFQTSHYEGCQCISPGKCEDNLDQRYDELTNGKFFTGFAEQDPPDDMYVFEMVYQPEVWCSLGAVTYGEINLCADMTLEKKGEDAMLDSAIQGVFEVNMGDLGRRCLVNVGTTENEIWESANGAACDHTSARLDETSSVLHDYAPKANALIYGGYREDKFKASAGYVPSNIGTVRPENPCNAKDGFFWDPNDRGKCTNTKLKESCEIDDWMRCKSAPFPTEPLMITLPCSNEDPVIAGKTYRYVKRGLCRGDAINYINVYLSDTHERTWAHNPGVTFEEKAHECFKACVLRTINYGGGIGWTDSRASVDKILGFSVKKDGTCRCTAGSMVGEQCDHTGDYIEYRRFDIVNCAQLHSTHTEKAISPHKIYINGEDLETLVTLASFKYRIRDTGLDELSDQLTTKTSLRATKESEYSTLTSTTIPNAKTALEQAKTAYDDAAALLVQMEAQYPTCTTTTHVANLWCFAFVWYICDQVTYTTSECSEKTQVKSARTAKSAAYTAKSTAEKSFNDLQFEKYNLEVAINDLTNEITTLQRLVNEASDSICSESARCDVCQGTCSSDAECRQGLQCLPKDEAQHWSNICELDINNPVNLGDLDASTQKYCLPVNSLPYDPDPQTYLDSNEFAEFLCQRVCPNAIKSPPYLQGCIFDSTTSLWIAHTDSIFTGDKPNLGIICPNTPEAGHVCAVGEAIKLTDIDPYLTEADEAEQGVAATICRVHKVKDLKNPLRLYPDRKLFLASFVPRDRVFASIVLSVNKKSYHIEDHFGLSFNVLEEEGSAPQLTSHARKKRDGVLLDDDLISIQLGGYVVNYGIAGRIPRPYGGQLLRSQNRGFVVESTNTVANGILYEVDDRECASLCEKTPGCTFSQYVSVYVQNSEADDDACTTYTCGPCEGDTDSQVQCKEGEHTDRSSGEPLHHISDLCVRRFGYKDAGDDYCIPNEAKREDMKCMLYTDSLKPENTFTELGNFICNPKLEPEYFFLDNGHCEFPIESSEECGRAAQKLNLIHSVSCEPDKSRVSYTRLTGLSSGITSEFCYLESYEKALRPYKGGDMPSYATTPELKRQACFEACIDKNNDKVADTDSDYQNPNYWNVYEWHFAKIFMVNEETGRCYCYGVKPENGECAEGTYATTKDYIGYTIDYYCGAPTTATSNNVPGCWATSSNTLYFNVASSDVDCGYNGRNCICRTTPVHTLVNQGNGPMAGDEKLYYLLGDFDPAKECMQRCLYDYPTSRAFYIHYETKACHCVESCESEFQFPNSDSRAYSINVGSADDLQCTDVWNKFQGEIATQGRITIKKNNGCNLCGIMGMDYDFFGMPHAAALSATYKFIGEKILCKDPDDSLQNEQYDKPPGEDPAEACLKLCMENHPTYRGFLVTEDVCTCQSSCKEEFAEPLSGSTEFSAYEIILSDTMHQLLCLPVNDESNRCSVFPNVYAGASEYQWLTNRCPPARSGLDKMRTNIVRVGKTFKITDAGPYATVRGHPDLTDYPECEAMCAEHRQCQAWHFLDLPTPERGDDEVVHACRLFDYVPPMVPTSSALENVFSGRTRIGTIQRDFSPINIFMDDGDHPACECDDESQGEGFDCGCVATSPIPYDASKKDDSLWGCSGHGECGGLGYMCICNDGYNWAFEKEDTINGVPSGFTCRACRVGTYKNSDVKQCSLCPIGKYQDGVGAAQCKACPSFKPTTQTLGSTKSTDCQACPPGRIEASLDNPNHDVFINMNYDPASVICRHCSIGKYDTGYGLSGTRTCTDCPRGKTTSREGMDYCDVTTYEGLCNNGKGWADRNTDILGDAGCLLCSAGMWNDDAVIESCKFCGAFRNTNSIGSSSLSDCQCARGYKKAKVTLLRGTERIPAICNSPPPAAPNQDGYTGCAGALSQTDCQTYSPYYKQCCQWVVHESSEMCIEKEFLYGGYDVTKDIQTCEDASLGKSPTTKEECQKAVDDFTIAYIISGEKSSFELSTFQADFGEEIGLVQNCFDGDINTFCATDYEIDPYIDFTLEPGVQRVGKVIVLFPSDVQKMNLRILIKQSGDLFLPCTGNYVFKAGDEVTFDCDAMENDDIQKVRIEGFTSGNTRQLRISEVKIYRESKINLANYAENSYVPYGCSMRFRNDGTIISGVWHPYNTAAKCGSYDSYNKWTYNCICTVEEPYDNVCGECHPGYYTPENKNECELCPLHYESPRRKAKQCLKCPVGKDNSNYNPNGCSNCLQGEFNDRQASSCTRCFYGKFTNDEGALACDNCASGEYQDQRGQSTCKICPEGYFGDPGFEKAAYLHDGYCYDDNRRLLVNAFPAVFSKTHPLYSSDKIEECRNRCLNEYGRIGVGAVGNSAQNFEKAIRAHTFSISYGDRTGVPRCSCSAGICARKVSDTLTVTVDGMQRKMYETYKILGVEPVYEYLGEGYCKNGGVMFRDTLPNEYNTMDNYNSLSAHDKIEECRHRCLDAANKKMRTPNNYVIGPLAFTIIQNENTAPECWCASDDCSQRDGNTILLPDGRAKFVSYKIKMFRSELYEHLGSGLPDEKWTHLPQGKDLLPLALSHPLRSLDPILECRNRCLDAYEQLAFVDSNELRDMGRIRHHEFYVSYKHLHNDDEMPVLPRCGCSFGDNGATDRIIESSTEENSPTGYKFDTYKILGVEPVYTFYKVGRCSDWVQAGGFGGTDTGQESAFSSQPLTDFSNKFFVSDKIEECRNRCVEQARLQKLAVAPDGSDDAFMSVTNVLDGFESKKVMAQAFTVDENTNTCFCSSGFCMDTDGNEGSSGSSVDYIIVTHGSCASNGFQDIETTQECRRASLALGRSIGFEQYYSTFSRPRCFTYSNMVSKIHINENPDTAQNFEVDDSGGGYGNTNVVCKYTPTFKSYFIQSAKRTYELIEDKAFCLDYTWIQLPTGEYAIPITNTNHVRFRVDKVEECRLRCLHHATNGIVHTDGKLPAPYTFSVRDDGRCACSTGMCESRSYSFRLRSYRMLPRPIYKKIGDGLCNDRSYLEGGTPFGDHLQPDDPDYRVNKIEECALRCIRQAKEGGYNSDYVAPEMYTSGRAFVISNLGQKCACSGGDCDTFTNSEAYTSYRIVTSPELLQPGISFFRTDGDIPYMEKKPIYEHLSSGICDDFSFLNGQVNPSAALPPTDPLYREDKLEECALRCLDQAEKGLSNTLSPVQYISGKAFSYSASQQNCYCTNALCESRVAASQFESYKINDPEFWQESSIVKKDPEGLKECTKCRIGQYGAGLAETHCQACSYGQTTLKEGMAFCEAN